MQRTTILVSIDRETERNVVEKVIREVDDSVSVSSDAPVPTGVVAWSSKGYAHARLLLLDFQLDGDKAGEWLWEPVREALDRNAVEWDGWSDFEYRPYDPVLVRARELDELLNTRSSITDE
jgi:hypothetical protein